MRRYYEENLELISHAHVRASQIVLAARPDCAAMEARIGSGEAFAELARAHSLHRESAGRGGDLGFFMKAEGPLGFEHRVFDLHVGEMRIFDSEDGCHLVRLTERDDPPPPPYEEVRERIAQTMAREQETLLLVELIEQASRHVSVERYELPE
ncbi:MAG: peptidylprolyl isomerase [SAR324 cluster bacterium]|nr:peptidylprolyl isomerase [SAR324 cluster bacterium]